MEKINGKSILSMAISSGPVNEDTAKSILIQILEGVKYMHKCGVVHRDLNPTNVFYNDTTNLVKILDFNVSKLICLSSS